MNYINQDKRYMTDEEWIRYLEESLRDLRKEKDLIRKEKGEYHHKIIDLEKENKNLKEELEKRKDTVKTQNEYNKFRIAENKKLKSDLSECECSMHFENDEVGFWKREYKRLKKWIKEHCNGYGNLFPEDKMKRQRKKADKKRK